MPWAKTEIVESFWRMLDQVQERLGVRRKKDTKMKIIMGKSYQLARMSDFVFLVLGLKQYLNPITTKKSKRQSLLWIQIRDEGRSKNNAYFSLIIIISPVTGSGRKFTVPLTIWRLHFTSPCFCEWPSSSPTDVVGVILLRSDSSSLTKLKYFRTAVERLMLLTTWPYHFIFLFLTVVMRSFNGFLFLSDIFTHCVIIWLGWFCCISFLMFGFFTTIHLFMSKIRSCTEKTAKANGCNISNRCSCLSGDNRAKIFEFLQYIKFLATYTYLAWRPFLVIRHVFLHPDFFKSSSSLSPRLSTSFAMYRFVMRLHSMLTVPCCPSRTSPHDTFKEYVKVHLIVEACRA